MFYILSISPLKRTKPLLLFFLLILSTSLFLFFFFISSSSSIAIFVLLNVLVFCFLPHISRHIFLRFYTFQWLSSSTCRFQSRSIFKKKKINHLVKTSSIGKPQSVEVKHCPKTYEKATTKPQTREDPDICNQDRQRQRNPKDRRRMEYLERPSLTKGEFICEYEFIFF